MRASFALLALASAPVLARENATSAFQVFRIKDCEECILDEDSVWCSEGSGFIRNATLKVTLGVNPDNGELEVPEYCWEGTFSKLLKAKGNFTGQFNSPEWVVADLECDGMKLYYNQCIVPATLAIILMAIGGTLCCGVTIGVSICCGLCRCGTESNWGCCQKFCPAWWPCCKPPPKTETTISEDAWSKLTARAPDPAGSAGAGIAMTAAGAGTGAVGTVNPASASAKTGGKAKKWAMALDEPVSATNPMHK